MSVMLFAFDAANQLIREDNGFINKTVTYTYDAWGNILTKSEYPYTTGTLGTPSDTVVYTYGNSAWGDQLTSYNGEAIRYDDSGNPISYRGYTMAWQGKRLTSATKTGTAITYSYDENGIRTQKSVNGVSTNYYYNGSVLISQVSGNDTLLFSYDANGSVVSVNFNGTDYYYVRNGQGDVVKLIDGNGTTVTEYTYDTWGKLLSCTGSLSSTLGVQNPFRYRGYVYDTETGFYYLQSRYYDPEVCRFINADVYLSTGQGTVGYNMYAYCLNNPVNMSDPSGCASKKDKLLTTSDRLFGGWKPIDDQNSFPYASFLFGDNGTMSDNGCGIIALYNLYLYNGGRADFTCFYESITKATGSVEVLGGDLGTNPFKMTQLIQVALQNSEVHFGKELLANHDAYVYLYLWIGKSGMGAHYVATTSNSDGTYTAYNDQWFNKYGNTLTYNDVVAMFDNTDKYNFCIFVWGIDIH